MAELEAFQNQQSTENLPVMEDTLPAEESLFEESECEYASNGNIMATTFMKVENKKKDRRCCSEGRKAPNKVPDDLLKNRHINDRGEMELEQFKAEIERKFKESSLKAFKMPRCLPMPAAMFKTHIERPQSQKYSNQALTLKTCDQRQAPLG